MAVLLHSLLSGPRRARWPPRRRLFFSYGVTSRSRIAANPAKLTRELPGGRRHGWLQRYAKGGCSATPSTSSASRPRRAHVRCSGGVGKARRHGRRDDAEGSGDSTSCAAAVEAAACVRAAHARVYASRAGRMYTWPPRTRRCAGAVALPVSRSDLDMPPTVRAMVPDARAVPRGVAAPRPVGCIVLRTRGSTVD